jgi:hypothetical protein
MFFSGSSLAKVVQDDSLLAMLVQASILRFFTFLIKTKLFHHWSDHFLIIFILGPIIIIIPNQAQLTLDHHLTNITAATSNDTTTKPQTHQV